MEANSGQNVLEILKELNRTYTYQELTANPPKVREGGKEGKGVKRREKA
jgi:hypothetical protein